MAAFNTAVGACECDEDIPDITTCEGFLECFLNRSAEVELTGVANQTCSTCSSYNTTFIFDVDTDLSSGINCEVYGEIGSFASLCVGADTQNISVNIIRRTTSGFGRLTLTILWNTGASATYRLGDLTTNIDAELLALCSGDTIEVPLLTDSTALCDFSSATTYLTLT